MGTDDLLAASVGADGGMTRFLAREGVEARFGGADFGEVTDLDVGQYADPTDFGAQYYVFNHDVLKDAVRFVACRPASPLQGTLDDLVLSCQGAEYRARAVCVSEAARPGERMAYCFEVEERLEVIAPARERHGVECLGTALLLDAIRPKR